MNRNLARTLILTLLTYSVLTMGSTLASPLEKTIVESAGHPLSLWHKKPDNPSKPRKNILLLHGRTWSSLPDFDLNVDGEKLSLMDNLNTLGFSVWALDARGYGETPRDDSGWNTPNKASQDVAQVVRWIRNSTGSAPVVFGWSYGSMVAQLMVQQQPDLAIALILFGYPIDPEQKINAPQPADSPPKKLNTAKNAASDFITPGSISKQAIATYISTSLRADPIRADWNRLDQWNQLDASQIRVPVLLLQAEFDPLADSESHARFFQKLPNANKQWIVLAGGDHAALLETPKDRLLASIDNFVNWLNK